MKLQRCFEGKDSFLGNGLSIIQSSFDFLKGILGDTIDNAILELDKNGTPKHWVSNGIMQRTFFNIQSR